VKKNSQPREFPRVSKSEVKAQLPKSAAIFFRLTEQEKKSVDSTAKLLHLSTGEYLIKCHSVISEKLNSQ
jgi:hypothetical protein